MVLKLVNRAQSTLSASIADDAVTLAITSGDEELFPTLDPGDWFPITVVDEAGNYENMRCTDRDGLTLTVERAQEGSTARAFDAGAHVSIRLTAGTFHEHTRNATNLTEGLIANGLLPPRIREVMGTIEDADAVAATGVYATYSGTDNTPAGVAGTMLHMQASASLAVQEWQAFSAQDRWVRRNNGSGWGAWYRPYITHDQTAILAPAGIVVDYAGSTAPSGWLFASGQAVSRTTYADLFAAIGTAFGVGNGSTTFNLPDYRGRVGAGRDDMVGGAANRLTTGGAGINGASLGAAGGAQTHTLTTAQTPEHTHTGSTASAGAHTHPIGGPNSAAPTAGGNVLGASNGSFVTTASAGAHTHTFTTNPTGGGGAHPNVQPTIVVNKIIKI